MLGFGFPSVSAINDAAAVNGIIRDLNHPLPVFRHLALIIFADWTCQLNRCCSPLDHPGIDLNHKRLDTHIPHTWVIAQETLRELGISLRNTDLSAITLDEVNIQHVYNIHCAYTPYTPTQHTHRHPLPQQPSLPTIPSTRPASPDSAHSSNHVQRLTRSLPIIPTTLPSNSSRIDNPTRPFIPPNVFNNLSRYGFKTMNSIGHWTLNNSSPLPIFSLNPVPTNAPSVIKRDWPLLQAWISQLPQSLSAFSQGNPSLLHSRTNRQGHAESFVALASNLAANRRDSIGPSCTFATDASQIFVGTQPRVT
ncbi:hypothetical protein H0H92_012738, partial [Tricholoma furcatifolium]